MKKVILIIISVFLIFYLGRQVFWLIKENGNVIVSACNSSDLENINVVVKVDGTDLLSNTLSNKKLYDYKKQSAFIAPGYHEIMVEVIDKDIKYSEEFFVYGVNWIDIEFANNDLDYDSYEIQLTIGTTPGVNE